MRMRTIDKRAWKELPKDYKSVIRGQKYVLMLTDKGTALVPVKLRKVM